MNRIIETVDVDVPVSTAYNQWTQFESFPQFLSFVESIAQVDDTVVYWKVSIGGVQREFDTKITEQHPGRACRMDHAIVATANTLVW